MFFLQFCSLRFPIITNLRVWSCARISFLRIWIDLFMIICGSIKNIFKSLWLPFPLSSPTLAVKVRKNANVRPRANIYISDWRASLSVSFELKVPVRSGKTRDGLTPWTAKCLSDCLLHCLSYFTYLPAVKKRV